MQIFVQTMNGDTGEQLGEIKYCSLSTSNGREWFINHSYWAVKNGHVIVSGPRGKENPPE